MDTKQIVLRENWRFSEACGPEEALNREAEGAWYKGFDDSGWRKVAVPHDWSVEQPFSKECSSGTGYLPGGIGWYRVHFTLPEEYRGKNIRVVFDGVYKNSQVWCNSYYLGKRPYGYSTFSYDITHAAAFGETENVISVKVTHTDIADSRWFTGSGITRKVSLIIQEPVHPEEYGVFFRTMELDVASKDSESKEGCARIEILHKVADLPDFAVKESKPGLPCEQSAEALSTTASEADRESFVHITTVLEALPQAVLPVSGREIPGTESAQTESVNAILGQKELGSTAFKQEWTISLTLEGEAPIGGSCTLAGALEHAMLWSPEHPYLYRMKTWYAVGEGKPYLVDEQLVGIRSIHFDPDKGFFLNGVETKLKGVCVHHDGGALGAAMTPEVWQRRLEALKESGCNAIRCSHNPHMPELYDLCDHMGFLMMDEAFDEWENAKNKWSTGHNVYPPKHQGYFEDFPQWYEADLRAMVRRDRNHPSVVLWSIGNEIDYPNDPYCHPSFEAMTGNNDANKPAAERQYDRNKPDAERLLPIARRLEAIVREEDDSRPVTLAAAFPELSAETGLLDGLDVVGYNYKEHLYEADHGRFPEKSFLGSENSHSYPAWLAVRDNPYISGQFLWTGIDYLGEARGWPIRGSMAGILTCAGDRKPEFYRRKAFWQQEPVLSLATRPVSDGEEDWRSMSCHWNFTPGEEILVKIYSNLPRVSLRLNDEELGSLEDYNGDGAYCFKIPFRPGTLTALGSIPAETADMEVKSAMGNSDITATLSTVGPAAGIRCCIWQRPDALTGQSWEKASRQPGYLYQLELQLTDAEGRDVAWQEKCISVSVSGSGSLAALESGDLSDVTPYSEHARCTFHGRLAAFIRREGEGTVTVKFTTEDGFVSETEL